MKTTVEKVYKAYVALDATKVSTLETTERQTVTSLWYALTEIGEKHKALIDKANKNLMPAGYEELVLKGQYTPGEAAHLRRMQVKYEAEVEAVVAPEGEKEVEVDITQMLSLATVEKIIAENGWPMSVHRDLAIVIDPK